MTLNPQRKVLDMIPETEKMLRSVIDRCITRLGTKGVPVEYLEDYFDVNDKAASMVALDRYSNAVMRARSE